MITMKRLHLITKPIVLTTSADLKELELKEYEDRWLLQEEMVQHKRLRRFKQQLGTH